MANKKYYYYVLVLSETGAVFVTEHDREYSYWDKDKVPMRYTNKQMADEESFGLTINGFLAYTITSTREIKYQPYRYDLGDWKWIKKGE